MSKYERFIKEIYVNRVSDDCSVLKEKEKLRERKNYATRVDIKIKARILSSVCPLTLNICINCVSGSKDMYVKSTI